MLIFPIVSIVTDSEKTRSTIGVLKIAIAIVIVGCHIPIVNDSDSIGHPWMGNDLEVAQC